MLYGPIRTPTILKVVKLRSRSVIARTFLLGVSFAWLLSRYMKLLLSGNLSVLFTGIVTQSHNIKLYEYKHLPI